MKKNILEELKLRELIVQISDKKNIKKIIKNKNISIYCGFDSTNDSLHIGHLIPLLTLKIFQKYKYKIIILIGEFTSLIGDPSFQIKKRKENNIKKIKNFSKKIIKQIKKIIPNNIKIIKNIKWFKNMKINFFLNNICNNFNINNMLNKEFIKKRNNKLKNKKGITFKELSYQILQSYDYLYLFKKYKTRIQIGGSDQWGNITSGINLIKKITNKKSFGITLPLIKKKNGIKYSKSDNNIIWLDKNKTTPYEFYQYWLNISDNNTYKYIKQYSLINLKKIKYLKKNKKINEIKKILAKKITKIVHGKKCISSIYFATDIFFNKKKYNKITEKKFIKLFNINIPKIEINKKNLNIKNILILLKIVNSKSQAHNLIKNLSIKINNNIINDTNYIIKNNDKYFNKFTILKKGKKKFYLIKWNKQ